MRCDNRSTTLDNYGAWVTEALGDVVIIRNLLGGQEI